MPDQIEAHVHPEDGWFIAMVPAYDVTTQARTISEVHGRVAEAIKVMTGTTIDPDNVRVVMHPKSDADFLRGIADDLADVGGFSGTAAPRIRRIADLLDPPADDAPATHQLRNPNLLPQRVDAIRWNPNQPSDIDAWLNARGHVLDTYASRPQLVVTDSEGTTHVDPGHWLVIDPATGALIHVLTDDNFRYLYLPTS